MRALFYSRPACHPAVEYRRSPNLPDALTLVSVIPLTGSDKSFNLRAKGGGRFFCYLLSLNSQK